MWWPYEWGDQSTDRAILAQYHLYCTFSPLSACSSIPNLTSFNVRSYIFITKQLAFNSLASNLKSDYHQTFTSCQYRITLMWVTHIPKVNEHLFTLLKLKRMEQSCYWYREKILLWMETFRSISAQQSWDFISVESFIHWRYSMVYDTLLHLLKLGQCI